MNGGVCIIRKEELIREEERLSEFRKIVDERIKNAPEGSLIISKSNNCEQFYYRDKSTGRGKYMSKDNIDLIKRLAQKSYDKKILKCIEKRLPLINKLLKYYEENDIDEIFFNEKQAIQKLIVPVEISYEQLVQDWLSIPYDGKEFSSGAPVILTNKGLRVRSKSEKILADYFDSLEIKYKYECPLKLDSYGIVYPDFTFISPKTRKKIYWEHEGMMDNPDYARSAVKKIDSYGKNHIFPGENLILTFESSDTVINMDVIKEMTKRYLC